MQSLHEKSFRQTGYISNNNNNIFNNYFSMEIDLLKSILSMQNNSDFIYKSRELQINRQLCSDKTKLDIPAPYKSHKSHTAHHLAFSSES